MVGDFLSRQAYKVQGLRDRIFKLSGHRQYRLNEVLNNLGSVHYEIKNYREAKAEWEKALILVPSDTMVRENLMKFIYMNPALPHAEREMSPFVARFFR